MTSNASNIIDQAVARHSSGRVTIAWTGYSTGRLYLRTSADGGASFGSARYIGKTANWEPGAYPMYYAEPTIAIGTGVTYIAYLSGDQHDVGSAYDGQRGELVVARSR